MIGANLAAFVLLGQVATPPPPTPNPMALVLKLGSGRYAERQAAAAAIERIGAPALPALRQVRDIRDPEIRSRSLTLIAKIEGALLTQPTLITLDFRDRPLTEVVKVIGDAAGVKLALYPEQLAAWRDKRITLREPSPVPFWKALDRLCRTAQLQYNIGGMNATVNGREFVFPLFVGTQRPTGPMSDVGPFRVHLISLNFQREVSFPQQPIQPAFPNRGGLLRLPDPRVNGLGGVHSLNEQFTAQIQVAAEPRLALAQNGPLRLLEAVDERGQSLLIPSNHGPATQRFSGYFGLTPGSTLHLQVPLARPEIPGKTIKRLRGVLPVVVSTRKSEPLVVPLSGSAGKTFHNEDVTLGIEEIRVNPNTRQTSIELALRAVNGPGQGIGPEVFAPGSPIPIQRPDSHQQQIEVLDAQGRSIPWYHANDAEGSRMTLTLTPHDQGPPAEIRYYALAKATTEITFDFANVPMP